MIIIFSILISIILIASSYIITEKNAKYYLTGYWNLTPEKRQQVDLKGFLRNWKKVMWFSSGIITASSVIMYFLFSDDEYAAFCIMGMTIISFLVFYITGRKYWKIKN